MRIEIPGIPPGDPCLDGHFPGDAVVPAAVLISEACAWLAEEGRPVAAIRRAKFRRRLGPGEPFEIVAEPRADGAVLLRWSAAGAPLAEATALPAPADG